jgi:hypothetical protein
MEWSPIVRPMQPSSSSLVGGRVSSPAQEMREMLFIETFDLEDENENDESFASSADIRRGLSSS